MLFRSKYGKLIEINKSAFKNDKLYFLKIVSLFENKQLSSTNNSEQLMQSILSKL
jgi:hypothetical protein